MILEQNIICFFFCAHEDVSLIVCASCNVINIKYVFVCRILIFLFINYVEIELNIYVKLRYGINFRTSCGQVAD